MKSNNMGQDQRRFSNPLRSNVKEDCAKNNIRKMVHFLRTIAVTIEVLLLVNLKSFRYVLLWEWIRVTTWNGNLVLLGGWHVPLKCTFTSYKTMASRIFGVEKWHYQGREWTKLTSSGVIVKIIIPVIPNQHDANFMHWHRKRSLNIWNWEIGGDQNGPGSNRRSRNSGESFRTIKRSSWLSSMKIKSSETYAATAEDVT